MNMLDLVIGDDPRIAVSEMELQMEDYSGSYVTMSTLREKYPDVNFRLLVGADSYVGIALTTIDEVVDYIKDNSVTTESDREIGRR